MLFTTDESIRELNLAYRHKNRPTDVLSFSQLENRRSWHPLEEEAALGDLVISTDTLYRQALRFKVTPEAELSRLLTHGILHLLGYDHEKVPATEARLMRTVERSVIAHIKAGLRSEAVD